MLRMQLLGAAGFRMDEYTTALNEAKRNLFLMAENRVKEAEHNTQRLKERLTAVNPMAVLNRGYALVYDREEHLLTRAAEAGRQDKMTLQFADGRVAVIRKETI